MRLRIIQIFRELATLISISNVEIAVIVKYKSLFAWRVMKITIQTKSNSLLKTKAFSMRPAVLNLSASATMIVKDGLNKRRMRTSRTKKRHCHSHQPSIFLPMRSLKILTVTFSTPLQQQTYLSVTKLQSLTIWLIKASQTCSLKWDLTLIFPP